MVFQDSRGLLEVALLLVAALVLDFAEVFRDFLELAGEPLAVQAEGGEGAVGVDDVKVDRSLLGGWIGGAVEEGGFEQGDAVEAPGGVGEFLGELGFGGGGGFYIRRGTGGSGAGRRLGLRWRGRGRRQSSRG